MNCYLTRIFYLTSIKYLNFFKNGPFLVLASFDASPADASPVDASRLLAACEERACLDGRRWVHFPAGRLGVKSGENRAGAAV
jgi:hypothetical protein